MRGHQHSPQKGQTSSEWTDGLRHLHFHQRCRCGAHRTLRDVNPVTMKPAEVTDWSFRLPDPGPEGAVQ